MSIYLDNAATTFPKPEEVYRAVEQTLRQVGVAPGRGGHRRGIEAGRLVLAAREVVATLFGVADSARVIFTHSATESLNLAVTGLLQPGDHAVTTTMEHNSLARPLHLAARRGVEVSWVEGERDGFVDPRRVAAALRPGTRLVALSHCSNVTGTIQEIGEIGRLARRVGAFLLVDAAQSAGVIPIEMPALGIDLLAMPGHKGLFGPPGTGILCVGPGVELEPLMVGGTGGASSDLNQPLALPERFESGTMNTPAIAGLGAGVEFVRDTGIVTIFRHESSLVERILTGLAAIPDVTVHCPGEPQRRGGVISFSVAGRDPAEIGFRLDHDHDISIRVGLHCAPAAHRTIGTYPAGTIRVSPGWFNTTAEIDCFLEALEEITA